MDDLREEVLEMYDSGIGRRDVLYNRLSKPLTPLYRRMKEPELHGLKDP